MELSCHEKGKDPYFKLWHPVPDGTNLIIFMHSDGGSIVCNENIYPIKRGVLCFLGTGKYHYTMPNDPPKYERSKLLFSTAILRSAISALTDASPFKNITANTILYAELPEEKEAEAEKIFNELKNYENTPYNEAVLLSSVLRLLILIERYSKSQTNEFTARKDVIKIALDYINEHISESITLNDLSVITHMSKFHFCRIFKQTMGMPTMQYILSTRITLAKRMLRETDMSITEVSENCGFSSIANFSREFKKHTGETPRHYRNIAK
jgi:AraC-like DNA-binding protein